MPSGRGHIGLAFLHAYASEDVAESRCPTENGCVAKGSSDHRDAPHETRTVPAFRPSPTMWCKQWPQNRQGLKWPSPAS